MAIEQVFPNELVDVILNGINFLQKWKPLLKPKEQDAMKQLVDALMKW